MNERLRRSKRIVALCELFYNLERWKLLDCTRKQADSERIEHNLIDFLERDTVFTGRFAVTAMQRLHSIAEEAAVIAEYKELQKGKVLQAGKRWNLSGKIFRELELKSRSEAERKVLDEFIEGSLIPRK